MDMIDEIAQDKKRKRLLIFLIAAVVAVILVVIFLVVKLRGAKIDPNSHKGVAKSFMKALCEGDGEEAAKHCIEPIREDVAEGVNQMKGWLVPGIEATYKVGKADKLSDKEITDLKNRLKEDYGYEYNISKAYDVNVTLTIEVIGDSQSESRSLTLAKIDGTWYIADAF